VPSNCTRTLPNCIRALPSYIGTPPNCICTKPNYMRTEPNCIGSKPTKIGLFLAISAGKPLFSAHKTRFLRPCSLHGAETFPRAPKARNAIAWGNAPGLDIALKTKALKARNNGIPELERVAWSQFLCRAFSACSVQFATYLGRCPRLLHCAPSALKVGAE
jgi:hypothetical protein